MSTTLNAKTQKGNGIGTILGYPTLNIPYDGDLRGIYAGEVKIDQKWEKAAIHIGTRKTIGDLEVLCEAYLLDWEGDVPQGTEIEIKIHDKIRGSEKFSDLKKLKKQIAKDVKTIRKYFSK